MRASAAALFHTLTSALQVHGLWRHNNLYPSVPFLKKSLSLYYSSSVLLSNHTCQSFYVWMQLHLSIWWIQLHQLISYGFYFIEWKIHYPHEILQLKYQPVA